MADILDLLNAAYRVRRARFGRRVKLNFLANLQSGLCPEDCGYCSQSKVSGAPIEKYRMLSAEEVLACAERAVQLKAARLCLVASMRGPSDRDVSNVAEMVRAVKARYPQLEICACLGLLNEGQAEALKESGVMAYNHNLNTSERFYGDVCGTHGFADRLATVERAHAGGLSACSGAIFGMGESLEDVLDVAFRLRDLKVESIPVNFLVPVKGTPLADQGRLTPLQCLKILCLFRLLCPAAELRMAAGRELHLRGLQPLGLYAANSLFIGDYLTTQGQPSSADLEMIRDLGFEPVGDVSASAEPALPERVAFTSRRERLTR